MKVLRAILLLIGVMTNHFLMANTTLLHSNDSIPADSTLVSFFYNKLDNQQLGDVKVWDTTTLLASFYDPTSNSDTSKLREDLAKDSLFIVWMELM